MGKSSTTELVGRTIAGKFLVEDHIGSGAMGAVYRARQIALDKVVAIKVLHVEHADDATFAARFQREARAASRLDHPNSMQVIDFGEEPDGLLYIAMEYLDGRSLHRVLRDDGPMPPARIADVLMQTLAALAVAHDMGVVHRDLKPENIVVLRGTDDDGRPRDIVKVCDFGIAKISDSRAYRASGERESIAPVTTAGLLVGTPEYMSPEQCRGERLDARSNLYSVGVILYEMLAGRVPFEAENAIGVVLKHITDTPQPLSTLVPDVEPRLEAVCRRALLKDRDARYASARDMRADVRLAVDGRSLLTPEVPSVQVLTASPAVATAATVQMTAPSSRPEVDAGKPTLAGTAAPVEGAPRRWTALVAAAVGAVAIGFFGVLWLRPHARPSAAAAAPGARSAPETTLAPEPVAAGGDVPPLDTGGAAPGAAARPSSAPKAGHAPATSSVPPTPSVRPAASGAPSSSSSAPPAAPSGAHASPSAVASAAPAPAPAPSAAVDPDFDPDKGYAEVGLINAQGVRERAVRAAMRAVGLAVCYRRALRAVGARAVGVATLDFSFDEGGAARSAIVSGGDFLPGLARCVQGAAAHVSVPQAMVDSGGGTAEVTVAFRLP